jgi:Domain of unknown function (DUF4411)
MNNGSPVFLLDSDVFIAAKNSYYAFQICPGFWKGLKQAYQRGRLRSLDRIQSELLRGHREEDLVRWLKNEVPAGFFHDSNSEEIVSTFREVMLWVQRNPRFTAQAVAKFATEADGWLVAYSMIKKTTVITNEQPRPESKSRVLLPDVCTHFGIPSKDTFVMIKDLALQFDLLSPAG